MIEFADSSNIGKSRGLALQGALFGLSLALVSMMTVRLGPLEAGLGMLPLIAVFLWPRGASSGLSSFSIFIIGIIIDILGSGPVGLTALIYLAMYGVFQPYHRGREVTFSNLWLRFTVWSSVAAILFLIVGAVFIEGRTAVLSLALQALMACLTFPVLYVVRQGLRQLVLDPNEPGYT